MSILQEILSPAFPLRNSVWISLLVGGACPLVGAFLILRRLVLLGVALPQVSSCGIAFAFALPAWGLLPHWHDQAEERAVAFAGSLVFVLLALFALALLERRGRGLGEGRMGALFVLASAWGVLLVVNNPHGDHGLLHLLRGEIIAVSNADLALGAVTFCLTVAGLVLFQKEFVLVSFDREMALTLRKRVVVWDALLFTLMGLAISVATFCVGPMVAFGFLVLPPLIAHQWARTMRGFLLGASGIGVGSALAGFAVAFRLDLPAGPTDVALLGLLLALSFAARQAWNRLRPRRSPAAS